LALIVPGLLALIPIALSWRTQQGWRAQQAAGRLPHPKRGL